MITDDFSPRPIAPSLEMVNDEVQDKIFEQADIQTAKPYFHAAWESVEAQFNNRVEQLENIVSLDPKMSAEDLKIELLANIKAANVIKEVWIQVKNAVSAIEQTEQAKRTGDE